jgi:hypothetical protein
MTISSRAKQSAYPIAIAAAFACSLGTVRLALAADWEPVVTIKEVMEKTITPATNTLWNVPDAPTDEQWNALEEASVTLLAAASAVAAGGAGSKDVEWAGNPAFKAFNRAMTEAGVAALAAIRGRDTQALLAAGDVLYPPCEGCHLQFNPGVARTN